MNLWTLPKTALLGGKEISINSDFRDVLEIIDILQDVNRHEQVRLYVALALFYDEPIPPHLLKEAAEWMMAFIALGEEDEGPQQPKLIDWEQDRIIIAAEINKVSGMEIRALEYLHWWTFISYFRCIGEGQLSYIVSIREKLRRGKPLEKHEREFYARNRAVVDFKQKLTGEEQDTLNTWLGKGAGD